MTPPAAPATALAPAPPRAAASAGRVVELGTVRGAVGRGLLLLVETSLVPAALLLLGLRLGGADTGFGLVLLWRCGLPVARLVGGVAVPAAVWLSSSLFAVRAGSAWAAASVTFYLWQPVALSAVLGLAVVLSGVLGHPVTLRLTRDVVRLPPEVVADPGVRRAFGEAAVLWGGVHLVCAGLGALLMLLGPATAAIVVAQAGLGLVCTVGSLAGAVGWGVHRLRGLPDLTLRFAR